MRAVLGIDGAWAHVLLAVIAVLWAAALIAYDVTERRLPDWLTLPAAGIVVGAAVIGSLGRVAGLTHGLFPCSPWWGLVWPALYVALALTLGGVGGGDIKLALPLGLAVCGAGGVMTVWIAIMLSSLGTAAWAAGSSRKSAPHGPGMLVASGLVIAFSL